MYLFYTTEYGIDTEEIVSKADFEAALLEKRLALTEDLIDVDGRIDSFHGEGIEIISNISRLLKSGYGLQGEWGSFKTALEDFTGWCGRYSKQIEDWYNRASKYLEKLEPTRRSLLKAGTIKDCTELLKEYSKNGRCLTDDCSCVYWTVDRFDQHGVFTPLNALERALKAFDGLDRVKTYIERLKAKEGTVDVKASFKYVKVGTIHGILYGVNGDGLMTGYEKIVMNYSGSGKFNMKAWKKELNTPYTEVLKEIASVRDVALKELNVSCTSIECMKSVVSVGRYRLYQMRSYKMLWLSAMALIK